MFKNHNLMPIKLFVKPQLKTFYSPVLYLSAIKIQYSLILCKLRFFLFHFFFQFFIAWCVIISFYLNTRPYSFKLSVPHIKLFNNKNKLHVRIITFCKNGQCIASVNWRLSRTWKWISPQVNLLSQTALGWQ